VAKLNHLPGHGYDEIDKMECHNRTDEVFILLRGQAALITAPPPPAANTFSVTTMVPSTFYNVPAGCWHNIALSSDAELVIVEKDNTHVTDVSYHYLDAEARQTLKDQLTGSKAP